MPSYLISTRKYFELNGEIMFFPELAEQFSKPGLDDGNSKRIHFLPTFDGFPSHNVHASNTDIRSNAAEPLP